jgi:hypothetical protein
VLFLVRLGHRDDICLCTAPTFITVVIIIGIIHTSEILVYEGMRNDYKDYENR